MQQQKENIVNMIARRFVIFNKMVFSGIRLLLFKPYWKDNIITGIIFFSFVINLLLWYYLIQHRIDGNFPIILHYNLVFGVDYLGGYSKVYLIPTVGLAVLLMNTILGYHLFSKEKLASYFLQFNVLVIQIFLFFAGYLIIKVNS